MEKNKVYTLSEFCRVLRESQEFKPRLGANVESEDKKNNEKAVSDILKQSKEFDGGPKKKETRRENPRDITDFNKTTLDLDFAYEPSKAYKDRVKAQVHGFPSVDNEKNSEVKEKNKGLDFDGNEEFYDDLKKKSKEVSKAREDDKHAGLKSHNLPKETFKDNTIFNESKKMKRLNFSKTVFLNENDMIKRIPDDMKKDGNKFYMKDSKGNEYLVECKEDQMIKGLVHTNILTYENKEKLDEAFSRMKSLWSYKSGEVNKPSSLNENENVSTMLNTAKAKLITEQTEDPQAKFFKRFLN